MTIAAAQSLENIVTLTNDERQALKEFSSLLRQKLGSIVRGVVLFGSKTRGAGGKDSDIDVLVILTQVSWDIKKAISTLAAEENLKYNVLISTVRYDQKTWDDPVVQASPFGRAVRNEGVWL